MQLPLALVLPTPAVIHGGPAPPQFEPSSSSSPQWSATLRRDWDVLGPFPLRARETHFLSPGFPFGDSALGSAFTRNDSETWPSSLADGGQVGWSSALQDDDGHLSVSFPDIRFETIRAYEGWAALQHHAFLHTTLKIAPNGTDVSNPPRFIVVKVQQASFFAIMPSVRDQRFVLEWHAGNIYAYPRSPQQTISLPTIGSLGAEFDIFVSADYEIRLFGDPHARSDTRPVIEINFSVELPVTTLGSVSREPHLDVIPDFVDGWPVGRVLSIGLRADVDDWTISAVKVANGLMTLSIVPADFTIIAEGQSRLITLELTISEPYTTPEIPLVITLQNKSGSGSIELFASVAVVHHQMETGSVLRTTHLVGGTAVHTLAKPPRGDATGLPIVYLHGAAVEIDDPELPDSLSQQPHSCWGFDWHGPSTTHALATVPALAEILASHPSFSKQPLFREDSRFVLVGHSNGGQGSWFLASRHPDRVAAVMPAAAYMKSQQYVAWSMERAAHFTDPEILSTLKAAMAGDDNDLTAGNLVGMPILALHGGSDENVPTYHTRELVSTIRTWSKISGYGDPHLSFIEMPGRPHWFDGYFASVPETQQFLDVATRLSSMPQYPLPPCQWTHTVMWPGETGSLHGFRVLEVEVPGRLARLTVKLTEDGAVRVQTTNVRRFSIDHMLLHATKARDSSPRSIIVDEYHIPSSTWLDNLQKTHQSLELVHSETWQVSEQHIGSDISGPVSHALDTASVIRCVVADHDPHGRSVARRLAHILLSYLALDTEIITSSQAINAPLSNGTVIVISSGAVTNGFAQMMLHDSGITLGEGRIIMHDQVLKARSTGVLFRRTVFDREQGSTSIVFVAGTDPSGLERALRLVPFRTGVPIPEWIAVGEDADELGAGGIIGAGFWNRSRR
ncbi:hypothetical protein BKA62DRAFT_683529 [Auriculariales sp. MPI-PUGE-AT-0066]|nr:hypothetical protein BKA62DRAFT_683529 [Auriculariales sp. MPI-PUGE-AT-0066]